MKHLFSLRVAFVLVATTLVCVGLAAAPAWADEGLINSTLKDSIVTSTGLGTESPYDVAATLVTAFAYVIEAVAVILFIYAGFSWMLAGGNEDKVDKAKKTIQYTIIGALIIMASWGISLYVFTVIEGATGQGAVGTSVSRADKLINPLS